MVASIILVVPFSGCMGEEETSVCQEEYCFPLSSDEFNELLLRADFNVLDLASDYDRLRVRSTLIQENENGRGEIHWDVAKDDQAELAHTETRYTVNGATLHDWGTIHGPGLVNLRSGSSWFQLRDESLDHRDPFWLLAENSWRNPSAHSPPFSFDVSQFHGLSWDVTGDETSSQQVATSSNDTHDILISMLGAVNPEIMSIEVSKESMEETDHFSLVVSIGDEVELALQHNIPRIHLPFIPSQPSTWSENGNLTVMTSEVSGNFHYEANLSDIEIHSFSDDGSLASMGLSSGQENITLDDGTWWEFIWVDVTMEGLFSRNDIYQVRTNSTEDFQIRFYDHWGSGWTDDNFPSGL